MTRTETIRVSSDEKNRLDNIAEDEFGTTAVPYGSVVSYLAEQVEA
jgi:predicted transcriptional regulator